MNYRTRYPCSPQEVRTMSTEELRDHFLVGDIFVNNVVNFVYSHFDRLIVGGAMPTTESVLLEQIAPLKAKCFLERREMGVINVGGGGRAEIDGEVFDMDYEEALYIGCGKKKISFSSRDSSNPAKFYLNSALAHKEHPTKKVTMNDAEVVTAGSTETSNHRTINKLIVNNVISTCQLQMGMTELKSGNVWNTMPPHTHDRRMEVYFYFDVPKGQSVCHFLGQPQETRHIWVQNDQAVISPPWSVHAGAGTSNYSFIWGMAGENIDYSDMDGCAITYLR